MKQSDYALTCKCGGGLECSKCGARLIISDRWNDGVPGKEGRYLIVNCNDRVLIDRFDGKHWVRGGIKKWKELPQV